MTIILFIIILGVLVFVHECGHFFMAKKFGVKVFEFGLGFPPRMFGKQWGETLYSLNWLPIGGFVKIFGENPEDVSAEALATHKENIDRALISKPRWQQVAVLAAGVCANFALAWLIMWVVFMTGVSAETTDYAQYQAYSSQAHVVITEVFPDTPAAKAGIKPGDTVRTAGLLDASSGQPFTVEDVRAAIRIASSTPFTLTVERGGNAIPYTLTPVWSAEAGAPVVGISMAHVGILKLPIHLALKESFVFTVYKIRDTVVGIAQLIGGAFTGTASLRSITGPVGIAHLVGDAAKLGASYVLMFAAIISINLGVVNLLPLPALDGGRIVIVLLEALRRKALPAKGVQWVNTIGFLLLIGLMIIITIKDVIGLL
jgi:regulator of sigma E protease